MKIWYFLLQLLFNYSDLPCSLCETQEFQCDIAIPKLVEIKDAIVVPTILLFVKAVKAAVAAFHVAVALSLAAPVVVVAQKLCLLI